MRHRDLRQLQSLLATALYDAYREWDMSVERFDRPRFKRLATIREWMESGRLGPDLRWTS